MLEDCQKVPAGQHRLAEAERERLLGEALDMLDFPQVRKRLASETTFPRAGAMALSLTPSYDASEVARLHEETAEAAALLEEGSDIALRAVDDVSASTARAAKGGPPHRTRAACNRRDAGRAGQGPRESPILRRLRAHPGGHSLRHLGPVGPSSQDCREHRADGRGAGRRVAWPRPTAPQRQAGIRQRRRPSPAWSIRLKGPTPCRTASSPFAPTGWWSRSRRTTGTGFPAWCTARLTRGQPCS